MNQPDFQRKEQNFSGVANFYCSQPSRAYVVELGLRDNIRGDILQESVNATLRRMPYFADALVEHKGDFYFEIVRAFESSVYVDAFLEQFSRHGIAYTCEPESRYVTPVNGLITDLGLL